MKEIVKKIPIKRLLTETDNPSGPASYIGEKGMPILIRIVVEEIARIKGESFRQIEKAVEDNFVRLAGPWADRSFSGLLHLSTCHAY